MKQRLFEPNYKSNLGLKQSHAITAMPFGALLDVRNMTLDGIGGKSTRRGYQILFSIPGNPRAESLLDYRTTAGVQQVLAYAGTNIWRQSGVSAVSIRSGLTDTRPWQWTTYRDEVYGVNGSDRSFKYNGTTEVAISITPPPGHVTLTAIAGGTLAAGAYSYVVTFFDNGRAAESNPPTLTGAPSITLAGGNGTVRLSGLPTAVVNEAVTHFRIYRRGPAETLYTRVAQILYVAGGTFDDTGLAVGTIAVETDTGQIDQGNTPHPQSRLLLLHNDFDRLLMVDENNPTLLVYSKVNQPHAFPSANSRAIGRQDGNRILKLERVGRAVVIHKRSGLWILDGDPATTVPRQISGNGTQDFYTSAVAENFLVRLTPKGFYTMLPTQFSVTDLREDYSGRDIIEEERTLDWSTTTNVKAWNYRSGNSKHIYFFFPNTSQFATPTLVYDYNITPEKTTHEWTKFLIGTDIFSVADYQTSGQQRMIFGDGNGFVWQWDLGNSDGSTLDTTLLNGVSTGANTATILNDTTKTWTVGSLIGLRVTTISGLGANQARRITANTATQITVTPAWAVGNIPDATTRYALGAIDSFSDEFWSANDIQGRGTQNRWKRMRWIVPYVRQTGIFTIDVSFRRDFRAGFDNTVTLPLNVGTSESLWGTFIWGIDTWGPATSNLRRMRFNGKYHYYSIRYRNQRAAQRFFWDGHGSSFQILHDRNK